MTLKIYVASSWRNEEHPVVVECLKEAGFLVYDFKGDGGFHWSDIDPCWVGWTTEAYRAALSHPLAIAGFKKDFDAMVWADTFVLVQPCGRSAHLELGWAIGRGKRTAILQPDGRRARIDGQDGRFHNAGHGATPAMAPCPRTGGAREMTVYVDDALNRYGRMKMSHMLADTVTELHVMADAIGIARKWFQPRSHPHYDICQTKRHRAFELGAVAVTQRAMVEIRRKAEPAP